MDIFIFMLSKVPKFIINVAGFSALGYYSYLMYNYFKAR